MIGITSFTIIAFTKSENLSQSVNPSSLGRIIIRSSCFPSLIFLSICEILFITHFY
nr:MAG TPA: hypothetical protein [Bacteriophage sp.]